MKQIETRNLRAGEWVEAASSKRFDVLDPATDEVVASMPDCSAEDARLACDAAARAFPGWRDTPGKERGEAIQRLANLMRRDKDRLARLMTLEEGKPISESLAEIDYARSFLDWAAGEAPRVYGDVVPASKSGKRILALRQPVGVVTAITPWNFPAAMITRKLGPALAAGCTFVAKPPEDAPLSAIALAELAVEAELPAGVFNVVTTTNAKEIADAFLSHEHVRKLTFTGSTEVGRSLMRTAADRIVNLSLELGGHAPFLVFEDADLDAAAAGAVANKFRNAGQTCICTNRFLVQESIAEKFNAKLEERVRALKVGRGDEEGVDIGPLINDEGVEKVERHVQDALDKGATLRCGGKRAKPGKGLTDRFYEPTILEGVTAEMALWTEETFGPVCPVRTFSDEKEAVEMANDSIYGLAAYFYTRDAARLMRVAEALEYGIVGANDGAPSTAEAPFGGVKQSGFGREGGKYAMHEYTEIKYVSWGL